MRPEVSRRPLPRWKAAIFLAFSVGMVWFAAYQLCRAATQGLIYGGSRFHHHDILLASDPWGFAGTVAVYVVTAALFAVGVVAFSVELAPPSWLPVAFRGLRPAGSQGGHELPGRGG